MLGSPMAFLVATNVDDKPSQNEMVKVLSGMALIHRTTEQMMSLALTGRTVNINMWRDPTGVNNLYESEMKGQSRTKRPYSRKSRTYALRSPITLRHMRIGCFADHVPSRRAISGDFIRATDKVGSFSVAIVGADSCMGWGVWVCFAIEIRQKD